MPRNQLNQRINLLSRCMMDKPKIVSYSDLEKEKVIEIRDFKITNHLREFKKEYKNVKGISLLAFMKDINITVSSPKLLREYYFESIRRLILWLFIGMSFSILKL